MINISVPIFYTISYIKYNILLKIREDIEMPSTLTTIIGIIAVIMVLKLCKKIISKVIGIVLIIAAVAYALVQFGVI